MKCLKCGKNVKSGVAYFDYKHKGSIGIICNYCARLEGMK